MEIYILLLGFCWSTTVYPWGLHTVPSFDCLTITLYMDQYRCNQISTAHALLRCGPTERCAKRGAVKDTLFLAFISRRGGGPRVVVSTAAFHARVRGSVPGLGGLKETKLFLPHPRVKVSIVGSLRDREVACSASDRQGSNFESCVWRTVSSQSSHHPQEVLLAQFSLYVHKGGLKPDSFHFAARGGLQCSPCYEI